MELDSLTTYAARIRAEVLMGIGSRALTELRDRTGEIVGGRRCLVVGSAPHAAVPDGDHERVLGVNGSPAVARALGLETDVTVTIGLTTASRNQTAQEAMEVLRGCSTNLLVYISRGEDLAQGAAHLSDAGFDFDQATEIDSYERAAIIGEVCRRNYGLGPRDTRVSNGVFTMVLALWAGAASVTATGFSLSGGHYYVGRDTPREHFIGDRRCMRELAVDYGVRFPDAELADKLWGRLPGARRRAWRAGLR